MLRNFVRQPAAYWYRPTTVQVPRLVLCFSTSPQLQLTARSNVVRNTQLDASRSSSFLWYRSYSESGKAPARENSNLSSPPQPDVTWVTILESTAQAPFLKQRPPNPESALRRAFTLFYQIILSLNTLGDSETASHLMLAFKTAPVSPTSDIGRARRAIAIIISTIVDDISSIPLSALVREKHPEIFGIHGALVPLSAMHLGNRSGDVENWREFWARAEPMLLELDGVLYDAGFGVDVDEIIKEQTQEQDNKEKP